MVEGWWLRSNSGSSRGSSELVLGVVSASKSLAIPMINLIIEQVKSPSCSCRHQDQVCISYHVYCWRFAISLKDY